MANRNAVRPYLLSQLPHEVIPGFARSGLKRCVLPSLGQLRAMDDKGQMSFQAEGTHKRFIAVGLCSPESIVTMNHRELETPWVSQTMKER
jgi:hypothetical protein